MAAQCWFEPVVAEIPDASSAGASVRSGVAGVDFLPVTYVYAFDHKHRKPPMTCRPSWWQGGEPRGNDDGAEPARPPGFTVSTDASPRLHAWWLAVESRR